MVLESFVLHPQLPITLSTLDYSPSSGFSALLSLISGVQQLFSSNPIVMSVMSVMSLEVDRVTVSVTIIVLSVVVCLCLCLCLFCVCLSSSSLLS